MRGFSSWPHGIVLTIAILLLASSGSAIAADANLVRIATPRGAKQAFILLKPDKAPRAAVILFAGGKGALGLKSVSSMAWGAGNFLVRTRDQFAAHGFLVAVVDAPSDHRGGMNAVFRMSKAHAGDIGAVVAHLKKIADVPVWMVGTSMGTFSAADAAIHDAGVRGLVLTSTVTKARAQWKIRRSHPNGVASMPLERFKGPALIVSHAKDACVITPASDAPKLERKLSAAKPVKVVILSGGRPAQSEPCKAKSAHGYFGIEGQAVGAIAKFIQANSG